MSFILKFLFILLPFCSVGQEWQRVNTAERISFLFPTWPQKLNKMVNGIPTTIYQTKNLSCVFGVVCSDLSGKNLRMTPETANLLYEELKAGSLKLESAILKDERSVPYENIIIKEIEYSIIKDKHEMSYFKRFVFRDNYIYQISIGGRTRHMDILKQERERFFNSISFPEEMKKKL